jgi:hypothetical protein
LLCRSPIPDCAGQTIEIPSFGQRHGFERAQNIWPAASTN